MSAVPIHFNGSDKWALILGGSSGFGLATAKKLAACGMNICVVHRDRRGAMERVEREFASITESGVRFLSFNLDALSRDGRETVLKSLASSIQSGKVHILLHSIAFGSLKLLVPDKKRQNSSLVNLARQLGLPETALQMEVDTLFAEGHDSLLELTSPVQYERDLLLQDDEIASTIFSMGTSLLTWTKEVFDAGLFSSDARVIGLTSEGNESAWLGYAAVSAAKAALEAISRNIAVEFGAYGIRSNIIQAGITETPALRLIPGSAKMVARARLKNPLSRLTQVEDIANVVALLATAEASWINGTIVRVDGGERITG